MNALSTEAADETLSTTVKRGDMEAAIRTDAQIDLPPSSKQLSATSSGLPDQLVNGPMERVWLRMAQGESGLNPQQFKHYRHRGKLMESRGRGRR